MQCFMGVSDKVDKHSIGQMMITALGDIIISNTHRQRADDNKQTDMNGKKSQTTAVDAGVTRHISEFLQCWLFQATTVLHADSGHSIKKQQCHN